LLDATKEYEQGINKGQIPAPYVIKITGEIKKDDSITVAGNTIVFKENCSDVVWNSKTGLIVGKVGGVTRAINFVGQSVHSLPITTTSTNFVNYIVKEFDNESTDFTIEYSFWYY
jgi:hypothetical protein